MAEAQLAQARSGLAGAEGDLMRAIEEYRVAICEFLNTPLYGLGQLRPPTDTHLTIAGHIILVRAAVYNRLRHINVFVLQDFFRAQELG